MRKNRIRAASMRSACCTLLQRLPGMAGLLLEVGKGPDRGFRVSAQADSKFEFFRDGLGTMCYHSNMWETLQLLFELLWYLYLVGVIIFLPAWIWFKVFDWFFPSD